MQTRGVTEHGTTTALAGYKRALASLHASRGDALARIDEVLANAPDFVSAHCLRAAALILAGDVADRHRLGASVRAIEQQWDRASDRERRHTIAARAALDRLRAEQATILLVDQMAGLALALADRAYVIEGGAIVASGSATEITAAGALEKAYLGTA